MKKPKFFKSLLVAAGLLVGASAWAGNVTATLDHTAGAQWGLNTGASTVDAEKEHYNNDASSAWAGCAYAKFSFSIPEGQSISKATLTYSVNQGGSSGRNDIIYYMSKNFDLNWATFAGQTGTDLRNTSSRAGKAVEAAPTGGKGDRIGLTQDVTDAVKAIFNEGQSYIIFQWTGNAGGADLYGKSSTHVPSLVIETADASNVANYTINYKLGEAVVKTVSSSKMANDVITAEMAVDGEGDYAGNHYLITAETAPSLTLTAGDNTLDVPVRTPYTATLTLTTTINGIDNVENITLVESDNKSCAWNYPYSMYVKSGDIYYLCDANTFVLSGTFTNGDVIEKSISYSTADESIVFFGEVENLNNAVYPVEGDFSGGKRAAISGSKIAPLTTLPAGIYEVSGTVYDNTFRGLYLRKSNSVNESEVIVGTTTADGNLMSAKFVLSQETSVNLSGTTLSGKVNQSADLDYVLIKKLGEINTMSIVGDFSENGWVTESGIAMTQSTENPDIWTAVVEGFVVNPSKMLYKYKAVANEKYGVYDLGKDGDSSKDQEYDFDYDGARAGVYTLTFTANTKENKVSLAPTRTDDYTYTVTFVNVAGWASVKAYAWNGNGDVTAAWHGDQIEKTGTLEDYDVYTYSYKGTNVPTKIIFNDGGSNKTGDLDFSDGAQYTNGTILHNYSVSFTTNLGWQTVKAYVWSGDGQNKLLGEWNSDQSVMTLSDDVYTISFKGENAPESIIFHNGTGSETSTLAFENGKAYSWNSYTVYYDNTTTQWANVYAWAWNVNADNTKTNLCGDWPGIRIGNTSEVLSYTYTGAAAPDMILFNGGSDEVKTEDFTFENGKTYTTAGPNSVDKTITAAGYATYCSPYALDFTGSSLTAYVASKGADNKVTFSPITKVPANTGILLKGNAGTYAINTTTGDTEPVTDNALVGVLVDTEVPAGSFVLLNGSKGVGFYRALNAFTVSANTAYIEKLDDGARTFIGFNFDESTGIDGIAVEKMSNGEVYNLQGQRVTKAQKGLYIINGKKVLVK